MSFNLIHSISMNKRFKSVSMLLFLGSISTGIVNATPTNDEMAVSITQQAATFKVL